MCATRIKGKRRKKIKGKKEGKEEKREDEKLVLPFGFLKRLKSFFLSGG
jgi:hypothetical protein